jgi:hypothetical protein
MFLFDPNSTKNQGRWRLRNPQDFSKMWTEKDNNFQGISYIVGILKENNEKTIQAIRFNKNIWSEEKASQWWSENKNNYTKLWQDKDWDDWKRIKKELITMDKKRIKLERKKGLEVCRKLADIMKLKYISPNKITIDYKFEKDCLLPVGSIRQGKEIIGDIDVVITCPLKKDKLAMLDCDNIKNISGGEKRIDFHYYLPDGFVNINVFVFLDKDTFGAALLHSSGPYTYNVRLRNRLHTQKWISENGEGWKLSQNGLINNKGEILSTPTERILQQTLGITERKPLER